MRARIENASVLIFALILIAFASFAHGQSVTATPYAVNQNGAPIPSAQVTICATNPGVGTCGSKAVLFTDSTLTTQCSGTNQLLNNQAAPSVGSGCSNPGFSDNLGNVIAFAASGTYFCQYSGPSFATYTQPCPVGGSLPMLLVSNFGATGNGSTDDTAAIQNAVNACPQTSPKIGCDIWFAPGIYKTSSTINSALLQGVHLHGLGTCGINTCSVTILTTSNYFAFTIGTGSSPNTSGFVIEHIGCQDNSLTGLGCLDIKATNDVTVNNVSCTNYNVGACYELDGGVNFTQWVHFYNTNFWHAKFGYQTNSKTASVFILGGQGNCVNNAVTDVISGSIGIDIGFTNHAAGAGTGSEWAVNTQIQNCQAGIEIWNGGGNHFFGKAIENTFIPRPNGSIGVGVFGDATCGGSCSFLANGNTFSGVQVTGAGTGWFIGANTANTTIENEISNGTNGVELNIDSAALSATKLQVNKRWTGAQVNIATIARSSGIVTATTAANAYLSLQPQTLVTISGVTSTTNNFNGTFPLNAIASTNDSTGVTTLTWAQAGATESGTTNAGGCQGAGSCVLALSTVQISGVGTYEFTGENVTQDTVEQSPTLSFSQSNFPGTIGVPGAFQRVFDGLHEDVNEAQNGTLHLLGGNTVTFSGGTGGSFTPQPTTVLIGANDTVNTTSGASVTVTLPAGGGNVFTSAWIGASVVIASTYSCTISAVASQTSLTASSCSPTIPSPQTSVSFNTSGIPGVQPCATLLNGGLCPTSDDKNHIVVTNSTTVCLPPPGKSKGYPPGFSFTLDVELGAGSPGSVSVTPAGATSAYSIACAGTATQFGGSSSATSFTTNQGVSISTDGTNWFPVHGNPSVPVDQIQGGITPNQSYTITGAPWNSGGSGANNGESLFIKSGLGNSTGGRGGDVGIIAGADSASGANGSAVIVQTFNAGISLAGKEGFIVRICKDVAGTDCQNVVPANNSGAVRLTVSGTDTSGQIGIVYSGNPAGSPVQVLMPGSVYGTNMTNGGVAVETTCTAGQYVLIAGAALDNGAARCSSTDGTDRIGYALTVQVGSSCGAGTPCHVPIVIAPR